MFLAHREFWPCQNQPPTKSWQIYGAEFRKFFIFRFDLNSNHLQLNYPMKKMSCETNAMIKPRKYSVLQQKKTSALLYWIKYFFHNLIKFVDEKFPNVTLKCRKYDWKHNIYINKWKIVLFLCVWKKNIKSNS